MNKYRVTVELECTYELNALNEETAKDIAYEWTQPQTKSP